MARVLVTGAGGLLGTTLVPELAARGHEVLRLSRGGAGDVQADLNDAAAVWRVLDAVHPEAIVNLAALTDVDACERSPHLAYAANTRVVESLARWLQSRHERCHLVQVSTDQVYDGDGPHTEEAVCPVNYYAFSKYAGELVAAGAHATILRTNLFGRSRCPGRTSLSDWLVGALRRCEAVRVFDDVLFSPLSLETLSSLIALCLERRIGGVFNLGSREGMSKADFAFALAACLGMPAELLSRARCSDLKLTARRPTDMRMDCTRFAASFGVNLPTLDSEIHLMRNAYATSV